MGDRDISLIEKDYRSLVLSELRELNGNQKETGNLINEVNRRIDTIAAIVTGPDGKNGLRSRIEKLEEKNEKLEDRIDKLERWQIKVLAIFGAIQVIGGLAFTLVVKFWK